MRLPHISSVGPLQLEALQKISNSSLIAQPRDFILAAELSLGAHVLPECTLIEGMHH